jgi:nucleotide-binding universal stress UspA family protein
MTNLRCCASQERVDVSPAASEAEAEDKTRRIVFAVDGTPASEQGLAWLTRNVLQKSTDVVYLANIVCDSRTPSTGVGSYSSHASPTQWTPSREEQSLAKEVKSRAFAEAMEMLESRYKPVLDMQGVECKLSVLPIKLHKSAGSIAEGIVHAAVDLGADLVVLCSHGPGARTDFGSVARWCEENSPIPTMLLPPSILTQSNPPSPIQMGASNSVLVASADDLDGLKRCFEYAVTDHTRPGDGMYVVHAIDEQQRTDEEMVRLRKDLAAASDSSSLIRRQRPQVAGGEPLLACRHPQCGSAAGRGRCLG